MKSQTALHSQKRRNTCTESTSKRANQRDALYDCQYLRNHQESRDSLNVIENWFFFLTCSLFCVVPASEFSLRARLMFFLNYNRQRDTNRQLKILSYAHFHRWKYQQRENTAISLTGTQSRNIAHPLLKHRETQTMTSSSLQRRKDRQFASLDMQYSNKPQSPYSTNLTDKIIMVRRSPKYDPPHSLTLVVMPSNGDHKHGRQSRTEVVERSHGINVIPADEINREAQLLVVLIAIEAGRAHSLSPYI